MLAFELSAGRQSLAESQANAGRDGPEARSGAQRPVEIPTDVLEAWYWDPSTYDPHYEARVVVRSGCR
jgi:hypothetical protein